VTDSKSKDGIDVPKSLVINVRLILDFDSQTFEFQHNQVSQGIFNMVIHTSINTHQHDVGYVMV
jgi:hypothetical protein